MSTLQDMQNSMCSAMNILADNAVTKSNATITLECKIIAVVDAAIGLYKVEYLGNQFEVYSNPSVIYNTDDIVYVLVPDGDLSKTKTIIGGMTPSASMYISDNPSDNYIPISDNLFGNMESIDLCSYHSEERNIDIQNIPIFNTVIQDYLENYNTFLFSAKIKTSIPLEQQQSGNYGLILSLPFLKISNEDGEISSPIWKNINIDINSIQGNPYSLNEYSLQNIYFQVDAGEKYDPSYDPEDSTTRRPLLTAFVKDFAQSTELKDYDIFIKDINLQAIDVLTVEEKQGYNLTIVASEGNYFLNDKYDAKKTLTPLLKINGKDKNIKSYDCYWFVEDSSIMPTSEGYSSLGGIGWKCLNEKTNVDYNEDGRLTYQYVTNNYKLIVNQQDVIATLRYKCILVQNDIVISGIVKLKNLNSDIRVELVSGTGSSNYVKDIGYVTLIGRIYYPGLQTQSDLTTSFETAWQRFDRSNNYLGNNFFEYVRKNVSVTDNKGRVWYETEIRFPCSTIDQTNLINCTFYSNVIDNDNNIIKSTLGTDSILITTTDNFNYKIAIQNGDVVYKYDADGDSPKSADYDGPLTSVVKEIPPLSFKIYKNDGSELTDTEYLYCKTTWRIPKNSMIKLSSKQTKEEDTNYYYIKGQGQIEVYYDIINSYNVKKNDNSIFLTVEFNGNVLNETANIKFLKDGESGTNGSKYTAIVQYDGHGYGEPDGDGNICKLHCIEVDTYTLTEAGEKNITNQTWGLLDYKTGVYKDWLSGEDPEFTVNVYCDGELITDASQYSVSWSLFDNFDNAAFPDAGITTDFNIVTSRDDFGIYHYKLVRKDNPKYSEEGNINTAVIAQAKIAVGNEGTTNSRESIYAYYPIETTFVTTQQDLYGSIIPSIEGGFDKVLYAADGTNPKYDNTNAFSYNDNLQEETDQVQDYYNYEWSSLSENLVISGDEDESSAKFKARTKFDNGDSNNGIKLTLIPKDNLVTRVQEKLNQLNSEIAQLRAEEYYYDGIISNLKQFLEFYDYNRCLTTLDNIKSFLTYRYNLIIYVDQLLEALSSIVEYCDAQNIDSTVFYVGEVPAPAKYFNTIKDKLLETKDLLYKLGTVKPDVKVNPELQDGYPLFDQIALDILVRSKINILSPDAFKEDKGVVIFEILNSYLSIFNTEVDKYNDIYYNNLYSEENRYEQYKLLRDFYNLEEDIINIRDSEELDYLSSEYSIYAVTILPEADFVILKSQISKLATLFWSTEDQCNNYDAININILKELQKIFVKYEDSYYDIYYQNLRDLAIAEIQKRTIKCNDYNRIIFEGFVGDSIIHVKPIVMLFNRYEMSNINGWDGNKLYTGNNDDYLLAPQIGAGMKNDDNTFTGLVMGVKKLNTNSGIDNHIGLFGFNGGQQTYFLNAKDGSSIMGASGGGQIIVDPEAAIIVDGVRKPAGFLYSANYWKEYKADGKPTNYSSSNRNNEGLLIDLTTPEIKFGSGNFEVNSLGHITAKGGGSIGGWKIDDYQLYSDVAVTSGRITLDSGSRDPEVYYGYSLSVDDPTKVPEGEEGKQGNPQMEATLYVKIVEDTSNNIVTPIYIQYKENDQSVLYDIISITEQEYEKKEKQGEEEVVTKWTKYLINFLDGTGGSSSLYTETDLSDLSIFIQGKTPKDTKRNQTAGKIYSHQHSEIGSVTQGFYLSYDGLSIGSQVYIGNKGVMKLGYGAVASVGDKTKSAGTAFWTVSGGADGSYIAYNTTKYKQGNISVYLGTKGISTGGSKFYVGQDGKMHSEAGTVGGWNISSETLSGGGTTLNSNGTIRCSTLYANGSGEIGGWHISSNELSNNDLHLYGNGSISATGFSLNGNGLALTGGSIAIGNFALSADNLEAIFSASNLKIGNKDTNQTIAVYVDEIVTKKIKAEVAQFLTTYGGNIYCSSITLSGTGTTFSNAGTFDVFRDDGHGGATWSAQHTFLYA